MLEFRERAGGLAIAMNAIKTALDIIYDQNLSDQENGLAAEKRLLPILASLPYDEEFPVIASHDISIRWEWDRFDAEKLGRKLVIEDGQNPEIKYHIDRRELYSGLPNVIEWLASVRNDFMDVWLTPPSPITENSQGIIFNCSTGRSVQA